jgi:hypothetical protein
MIYGVVDKETVASQVFVSTVRAGVVIVMTPKNWTGVIVNVQ